MKSGFLGCPEAAVSCCPGGSGAESAGAAEHRSCGIPFIELVSCEQSEDVSKSSKEEIPAAFKSFLGIAIKLKITVMSETLSFKTHCLCLALCILRNFY